MRMSDVSIRDNKTGGWCEYHGVSENEQTGVGGE